MCLHLGYNYAELACLQAACFETNIVDYRQEKYLEHFRKITFERD